LDEKLVGACAQQKKIHMDSAKLRADAETKFNEIRGKLVDQAMQIREELVKASEKLKANPAVVKGLEFYDAQVKMLHDVQNSESAQKIMELLNKAKEAIVATIETVAASPMAQATLAKLAEYQAKGVKVLQDYQGGGGADAAKTS
jgi:microsomal dipeptidase-like Zn-dependent dipeptidase